MGYFFIALFGFMYFLPAWIAYFRGHRNQDSIAVLTLLLGWSGVFWIAAMVWAFWETENGLRG